MQCGILDFGMCNIKSVTNSLDAIQLPYSIVSEPTMMSKCDRFLLPGVGAFGSAMERIDKAGLLEPLLKKAKGGYPIIGICLGMQLLFQESEELGIHKGLGLLNGRVRSLTDQVGGVPVPHIGWNEVNPRKNNSSLFSQNVETFYFVHSYFCEPSNSSEIAGETHYGDFKFTSTVEKDHIFGCQFHPEKSQKAGLEILTRFGKLKC